MTDDPISLLARANPVPESLAPEPFERLLARLDYDAPAPRRSSPSRRRVRMPGFLVPVLGIIVTLAIAAAAIVLLHHRATRTGSHHTSTNPPSKRVPPGGMRGSVFPSGVAFSSSDDGLVSLEQNASNSRPADWLATTRDGGRHWQVVRARYDLEDPVFADANDGWSFGTSASGSALYYVTHDGGASWTPARLLGDQFAYTTDVAIARGTAWAIGNRCSRAGCTYAVMHGQASGSTLLPTTAQPAPHAGTMTIVAGSALTAYATTEGDANRIRTYATHDGGRHWGAITAGCRDAGLSATGDAVVWAACGGRAVATSDDGGQHWSLRPTAVGPVRRLVAVTATTAWAMTREGSLARTTDGGVTWHVYARARSKQPPALGGGIRLLAVLSATSAAVALDYPSGRGRTQILVARAIGAANPSSFVALPAGLRRR